ncbi:MAG: DNA adenine methylase [Oricola sp.]|jgi:DNA adenine methylase|nr:MAG: DNA adenine methylase [Oricola sp.]
MLSPVDPVHPPAAYLGGKRLLAKAIVQRLCSIEHDGYAEPFVGMGGVFFRRAQKPKTEVINDINGEIANLFRILQRHYPQFIDCLKFQITSRREFERLCGSDPATLTDLERAARFIYLQKTAYGGKVVSQSFGVDKHGGARFNLSRVGPLLEDIHERLTGVVIECLTWSEFIRRWDRPGMLFYCDPPYFGNEADYGPGVFGREDFAALATVLRDLKGRFVLSINDTPEIRETFAGFECDPVDLRYSIAGGSGTRAHELIISG